MSTAYRTFGVSPQATPDEIKSAYRALAKIWHPDRNGGDSRRMAQINAAYEELTKAEPVQPGGIHVEIFDANELGELFHVVSALINALTGGGLGNFFAEADRMKRAETANGQRSRSSKKRKLVSRQIRANAQNVKRPTRKV